MKTFDLNHVETEYSIISNRLMKKDPIISVLVPAYNEEAWIANTIDSIRNSFTTNSFSSYEIIVCNNNSSDSTDLIAQAKGAYVIFEPHNQIAKARNTAAHAAKGKWLIFVDADTFLNPELLRQTLDHFNSGKVAAGGSIIKFDTDQLPWLMKILLITWNWVSIRFKLAAGSYLYCERQAWSAVGGFDEQFYVSEEIDFSIKLKQWARSQKKEFKVITQSPITTSSRKLKWYTPWQVIRQAFLLLRPGAMLEKKNCSFWYQRPCQAPPRLHQSKNPL